MYIYYGVLPNQLQIFTRIKIWTLNILRILPDQLQIFDTTKYYRSNYKYWHLNITLVYWHLNITEPTTNIHRTKYLTSKYITDITGATQNIHTRKYLITKYITDTTGANKKFRTPNIFYIQTYYRIHPNILPNTTTGATTTGKMYVELYPWSVRSNDEQRTSITGTGAGNSTTPPELHLHHIGRASPPPPPASPPPQPPPMCKKKLQKNAHHDHHELPHQ